MDWKHIITKIADRHGMTQMQIAAAVGCAQATISDLLRGCTKEPGYVLGKALIELSEITPTPTPAPAQQESAVA